MHKIGTKFGDVDSWGLLKGKKETATLNTLVSENVYLKDAQNRPLLLVESYFISKVFSIFVWYVPIPENNKTSIFPAHQPYEVGRAEKEWLAQSHQKVRLD